MQIDKDASMAVVVKRTWANLYGVKIFLRPICQGLRFRRRQRRMDRIDGEQAKTGFGRGALQPLGPWSQILTIVVAKEFSPAIRQEARKIGFTGEIERE